MTTLLVATTNPGKTREFSDLLNEMGIDWVTPLDLGQPPLNVEESGETYEDNARLKAMAYRRHFNMPVLADDSGLEVDALNGEPGIRSARYGGPNASDADRRRILLDKLRDVPPPRTARFRCVVAVADAQGNVRATEGVCPGEVGFEERGSNGFGYDPIFYLPEYGQTMAELPSEIKNRISHRGRALQAAKRWILAAVSSQ